MPETIDGVIKLDDNFIFIHQMPDKRDVLTKWIQWFDEHDDDLIEIMPEVVNDGSSEN